tara:strand:+ start:2527 stop:2775 length:249 start_codon:yes stop_codon:yes gene_type:complete
MSKINTRLPAPPSDWSQNWAERLINTLELQIKDLNSTASPSFYDVSNVTLDRAYDANSTSTAELADVLGTLITDLKGKGIIS